MNPLGKTHLPLRLLLCSVLALGVSVIGNPAQASSETAKPRLIVYAGGESPGVQLHSWADRKDLRGAPKSFKRFAGHLAQRIADRSTCDGGYVGLTVERIRTDGYAVGGVNDCGGYAALWAVVDGRWKQIAGTQDVWGCRNLERHVVPSSIAGTTCYDYQAQRTRHYHQR